MQAPCKSSRFVCLPLVGLLVVSPLAIGCGHSGPQTYPIAIKVVDQQAQPVPRAQVWLLSQESEGLKARGVADELGIAHVKTEDLSKGAKLTDGFEGALAGSHQVAVTSPQPTGDPDKPDPAPKVAHKFSKFDQSGLSITVDPAGDTEFTVEVQAR